MVSITALRQTGHANRRRAVRCSVGDEQSRNLVERRICKIELFTPLDIGLIMIGTGLCGNVAAARNGDVDQKWREDAVVGLGGYCALPGDGPWGCRILPTGPSYAVPSFGLPSSYGIDGYLFNDEWPLYTFDGEFMMLSMFCFAMWYPERFTSVPFYDEVALSVPLDPKPDCPSHVAAYET